MSTAKELRESALKYGCEYNPKPEAIEVVEGMFNNCKYEKVDDKYTRVTIREMSTVIYYPSDCIANAPQIVDELFFYHRSVLFEFEYDQDEDERVKSLLDVGFLFVEAYLNKYHPDYYDKVKLYQDYCDR